MKTIKYFFEDIDEAIMKSITAITKIEIAYLAVILILLTITSQKLKFVFGGVGFALYMLLGGIAAYLLKKSEHKLLKKVYFIITSILYISMYPHFLMMIPILFFAFATGKEWRYLFIFLFVFTVVYPICLDYFIGMYVGF